MPTARTSGTLGVTPRGTLERVPSSVDGGSTRHPAAEPLVASHGRPGPKPSGAKRAHGAKAEMHQQLDEPAAKAARKRAKRRRAAEAAALRRRRKGLPPLPSGATRKRAKKKRKRRGGATWLDGAAEAAPADPLESSEERASRLQELREKVKLRRAEEVELRLRLAEEQLDGALASDRQKAEQLEGITRSVRKKAKAQIRRARDGGE